MKEIILASASPRRLELLRQIGVTFTIHPSGVEEIFDEKLSPEELVQSLSFQKAQDIVDKMKEQQRFSALVIGADTIVVKEKVLGKPEDEVQALVMLKSLQGQWHEVITGITIIDVQSMQCRSSFEKTKVKMRELTEAEIKKYIATGEPMDKAGAYGIQGLGAVLVERLEGCYFNVVGLPLTRLTIMLKDFGVQVL